MVGIVGGGAMGTAVAASLARAGIAAKVLTRSEGSAATLRSGVRMIAREADWIARLDASADPRDISLTDVILFLVKIYDAEAAASEVARAVGEGPLIASLMNGIGATDILSAAFGRERVVTGSTTAGAKRCGDGSVVLSGYGETRFAGRGARAEAGASSLAEAFRSAGFLARTERDPFLVEWEKALVNAGINPTAALAGTTNGGIARDAGLAATCEALIREGCAVARSAGIGVDADEIVERAFAVCEDTSGNECSMLQDVKARRRTEIDFLNGAIAAKAAALGDGCPQAPLNAAMAALVRYVEREGAARLAEK